MPVSLSISHLLRVILLLIPSCRSPCDELDEVVGEYAGPAVDLALPPSLVLDVLGDDVDQNDRRRCTMANKHKARKNRLPRKAEKRTRRGHVLQTARDYVGDVP